MLISNAITVAVTGWLLVPLLAKAYGGWLQTQSHRWNLAGSGSILALLMVCYAVFSACCTDLLLNLQANGQLNQHIG